MRNCALLPWWEWPDLVTAPITAYALAQLHGWRLKN